MKISSIKLAVMSWTLFLFAACGNTNGTISLVNRSNESISRATIDVSGQRVEEIVDLGPSEMATRSYQVTKDSHYAVEVVFRSGKRLKKDLGYVTNGFDFEDRIIVTESDLELQSSQRLVEKRGYGSGNEKPRTEHGDPRRAN